MIKRLLFFAYIILVTTLSLLPSSDLPKVVLFPHADKLIHMGMYGGFTFLLLWGWPRTFKGIRELLPLLIILVYGFVVELLQQYASIGRSFEFTDILANITGFVPGWLFYRFCKWASEQVGQ
jgi:glycopeptide antibiotics resistance protein